MACPYCGANEEVCEHLLLSVDTGEREAIGGELYELFNARWKAIRAKGYERDDDFDGSEEFQQCLDEVTAIATTSASGVFGGMTSSAFEDFYCSTPGLVDDAVRRYVKLYGAKPER